MKSLTRLVLLPLFVLAACGGDETNPSTPDAGIDAAVAPAPHQDAAVTLADAAITATDAQAPGIDAAPPQPAPRGMVVVHTDYRSSVVTLLDPFGNVAVDDCINSGSVKPKLSLALSGDVVPPSSMQTGHEVTIIDRSNDAITFLDPATCAVARQLSVATGFHSNPHDVAAVSGSRLYVTRYDANGKKTADPGDFDDGSDVLIVDAAGKPAGRIDLTTYALPGTGGAPTLPRPDRAIALGDRVYVTLNNLSADFGAAGAGRVVVIDPARDAVTGTIDLPTVKNCGSMHAAGPTTLLVSCGGAFSDGAKQVDFAGIAWIDLSTNPPKATVYASKTAGGRTVSGATVAATSPDAVFVVTNGDFMGPVTDQLWMLRSDGSATKIYDGKSSFVLGDLVLDPVRGRLFVTDASSGQRGVQIFDVSNPAAITRMGQAPSSLARGLPPRYAAWY